MKAPRAGPGDPGNAGTLGRGTQVACCHREHSQEGRQGDDGRHKQPGSAYITPARGTAGHTAACQDSVTDVNSELRGF